MLRIALLCVPAFLAALLPSLLATGGVAGFLWIYVYGDDTWPALAEAIIVASFLVCWVSLGVLLTWLLESNRRVRKLTLGQLAILAAVISALAVGVLLLHQGLRGNLGGG